MKDLKKITKAAIAGVLLSGVLMTTACSGGNHDAAAPAPTASQSVAAPSESPTPTPSASAGTIGPWGINIDDVLANHLDKSVGEVYPNETKADLKEGVLYALNTYQGLVGIKQFYRARTVSDNTLLVPDEDKFDKTFYDAMAARTDAHGGQFQNIITFGKAKGSISKDLIMDPTKDVNFVSHDPVVYASSTEGKGNDLVVKAKADLFAPTTDGKLVTLHLTYWIGVNHGGSNQWVVADLDYHIDGSEITNSVAAPETPNGK